MVKNLKKDLVSVIIPAFNEEKTIGAVIKDIFKLSQKYKLEIIVVNDGSSDATALLAKKVGAHKVISHKKNLGKGAAFQTGYKNAKGSFIVQIDADRQLLASDIPKLITPLQNGFDVALGSRYSIKTLFNSDSASFVNTTGNLLLSFIASLFAQKIIIDVMTGFKAFKKDVLYAINPTVNHFGYETELVIKAAKKKYKIKNVLISVRKRSAGKSNLRIFRHGALVLKTIIDSASRH